MQSDSSRRLGSGAVGSGEVPTCSLLVRKFLMQEMNVRSFLIKGQGETCQGWGMAVPERVWEVRFHVPCSEDHKSGCHFSKEGVHLGGCSGV